VLILMVLWTIAYYYFFDRAGYLLATSVFLLGLLSYFNRKRVKTNVAVALGVAVVLDMLFSHLLSVPMPTGILPF
jgi:putative tricarboxylic transport membrane protein